MVEIDGKDFLLLVVDILVLITLCYRRDLHQVHICGRIESWISYFMTSSVHVYVQCVMTK